MSNGVCVLNLLRSIILLMVPLSWSWMVVANTLELVTSESMPFQSEHLVNQGPVPQLVKQAFNEQGIQANVTFMPWPRALLMAAAGQYHGVVGAWDSVERRRNFYFSSQLYQTELHLLSLTPLLSRDFNQLSASRKSLGLVRGYAYPSKIQELQIETIEVLDDEVLFDMFLRGRVDVILADLGSINSWQKSRKELQMPALQLHSILVEAKPVYFLLSKVDPANVERMQQFEMGLASLSQNGMRHKILSVLPTIQQ